MVWLLIPSSVTQTTSLTKKWLPILEQPYTQSLLSSLPHLLTLLLTDAWDRQPTLTNLAILDGEPRWQYQKSVLWEKWKLCVFGGGGIIYVYIIIIMCVREENEENSNVILMAWLEREKRRREEKWRGPLFIIYDPRHLCYCIYYCSIITDHPAHYYSRR